MQLIQVSLGMDSDKDHELAIQVLAYVLKVRKERTLLVHGHLIEELIHYLRVLYLIFGGAQAPPAPPHPSLPVTYVYRTCKCHKLHT